MGDVGTFVTLLDNILQILIPVKDFFASNSTTASIYSANRQRTSHLLSAIAQIIYGEMAYQSPCLAYFLFSAGRNDTSRIEIQIRCHNFREGVKSLIDLPLTAHSNRGRRYVCYFTGQCLSNLHSCHTSQIKAKSDFTPVPSAGATGQVAQERLFPALRTTPSIYPTDR